MEINVGPFIEAEGVTVSWSVESAMLEGEDEDEVEEEDATGVVIISLLFSFEFASLFS